MRITKYAQSEYHAITHNRFRCFYTVIKTKEDKEAHSVDMPNLIHSTIRSSLLTSRSAKTIGEIFLKIANELLKD